MKLLTMAWAWMCTLLFVSLPSLGEKKQAVAQPFALIISIHFLTLFSSTKGMLQYYRYIHRVAWDTKS